MTYPDTLDYLYSRLPMFTRIGDAAYKKDLHNTIILLDALGNPHHSFKSIHIAGTNGKGSTSHMLAAIFHECGFKTGLYTSPHLYDFRERIKVSGIEMLYMCPEDFVVEFTESIKPVIEEIEPSFFEVTVAMAFEWFARQKVDIAIIETGLGGRLDSTNVITPELSIITNIGWDHMNILGDTLEKIAFEKAGIIKENVPVVIGETLPETLPVFSLKAGDCNATLYLAEKEWDILTVHSTVEHLNIDLMHNPTGDHLTIKCDLPGLYQQFNIRTVLSALEVLKQKGWKLPDTEVLKALNNVKNITGLGGRWQVLQSNPYVVLDVAHNEAGIKVLLKQISTLKKEGFVQNIHMVIGMVKDKDVSKVLKLLPGSFTYYFTQAQLPRALPFAELREMAYKEGLTGKGFQHPQEALSEAKNTAASKDLIIVCGSVFVVAEINPG
ncbi:MAG: bifunctional folylpolyglutamate synthase/dihydrofolate synthase [Chitinophagaceae bacterium]|nr:bifunctional folylpolyglutamate synthase/dihydrofolate synthase [Chitinophagaceae bacterium]